MAVEQVGLAVRPSRGRVELLAHGDAEGTPAGRRGEPGVDPGGGAVLEDVAGRAVGEGQDALSGARGERLERGLAGDVGGGLGGGVEQAEGAQVGGVEEALVLPGHRHDVVGVPVGALGARRRLGDPHAARRAVELLRVPEAQVVTQLVADHSGGVVAVAPHQTAGRHAAADGPEAGDAAAGRERLDVDDEVLAGALDPADLLRDLVPEAVRGRDTAVRARRGGRGDDGGVGGGREPYGSAGDRGPVVVDAVVDRRGDARRAHGGGGATGRRDDDDVHLVDGRARLERRGGHGLAGPGVDGARGRLGDDLHPVHVRLGPADVEGRGHDGAVGHVLEVLGGDLDSGRAGVDEGRLVLVGGRL